MIMFIVPFILILILIIIVWIVRSSAAKVNQARGKPPPRFATTTTPGSRGTTTVPSTFGNVARDVTSHMFSSPPSTVPYVGYHRRDMSSGEEGIGVNRVASASQASLPAYGANTLPVPPEAAYEPGRDRYISSAAGLPLYAEAPPKYTAAIDNHNRQTTMV